MLPLPLLNVRLNACSEDWQQMKPTAQGHHCAQCNRTVLNFTTSTQAELESTFQTSPDGRVCGRFRPSQLAPPSQLRPKLRRSLVALVLVCGLGLTSGEAWAQVRQAAKTVTPPTPEHVFGGAEEMPVYKDGGVEGMMRFIGKNLRYPHHLEKGGRVYVQITVNEDGKVRNPLVMRGFNLRADAEALRVISMLGDFIPGTQNGRPVEVTYTVPITFTLD